MPKFLTDISPRNIGYKNGEFIVFDPARIDPYTVYVGSGVFAGLFSAGVASKLDEFIDGIIAGEAE